MHKSFIPLLYSLIIFSVCSSLIEKRKGHYKSLHKIEMNLSAFGVESDSFPSITGVIDFIADTSLFEKSYFNPAIKGSNYRLSAEEIKKARLLLLSSNLGLLKEGYKVLSTDQPTSIITISYDTEKITIIDYVLKGDKPLPDLYEICYKL